GTSNVGCEFWPTVTANNVWANKNQGPFHFGVLLGNVSATDPVEVTINGPNGAQALNPPLAAGEARAVPLDWILDLKGPDWTLPFAPIGPTQSVKKLDAAYRVRSSGPIVAYQWSALEPSATGSQAACPRLAFDRDGCHAYSTEASILLPA